MHSISIITIGNAVCRGISNKKNVLLNSLHYREFRLWNNVGLIRQIEKYQNCLKICTSEHLTSCFDQNRWQLTCMLLSFTFIFSSKIISCMPSLRITWDMNLHKMRNAQLTNKMTGEVSRIVESRWMRDEMYLRKT
jgi:hypothetical protein